MSRALELNPSGSPDLILNGNTFQPDVSGALYWPRQDTLIVSDLHFEKGSFFASRNQHLPPYDTSQTLSVLERTIARYQPGQIIALGDSFHDINGAQRLSLEDRDRITALTRTCQWIWIAGNHDPAPAPELGGEACQELTIDGIILKHEPSEILTGPEIAGHLHPVATIATKARKLRRRAFVANHQRLIMPAFGAYTGGLNICSEAFQTLLKDHPFHAWALGENQVFPISSDRLRRQIGASNSCGRPQRQASRRTAR